MNLADAIQYLEDGQAVKRPSWGGYIKKTVTSAADATPVTFTLTWKKRNGNETVYTWNGSAWVAPGTALSLDADLMTAICASDWIVGRTADFEAARSGSGVW